MAQDHEENHTTEVFDAAPEHGVQFVAPDNTDETPDIDPDLIAQAQRCVEMAEQNLAMAEYMGEATQEMLDAVETAHRLLSAARGGASQVGGASISAAISSLMGTMSSTTNNYALMLARSPAMQIGAFSGLSYQDVQRIQFLAQDITPENVRAWTDAYIMEENPVVHAYRSEQLADYLINDPRGQRAVQMWNELPRETQEQVTAIEIVTRRKLDARIAALPEGSEQRLYLEGIRDNRLYVGLHESVMTNAYLDNPTPEAFAQYQHVMAESQSQFAGYVSDEINMRAQAGDPLAQEAQVAADIEELEVGDWAVQRTARIRAEQRDAEVIHIQERIEARDPTVTQEERLDAAAYSAVSAVAEQQAQERRNIVGRILQLTNRRDYGQGLTPRNQALWETASNPDEPMLVRQEALFELVYGDQNFTPLEREQKLRLLGTTIRDIDYVDPNNSEDMSWSRMLMAGMSEELSGRSGLSSFGLLARDGGRGAGFWRRQTEIAMREQGATEQEINAATASIRTVETAASAPHVLSNTFRAAGTLMDNINYDNDVRALQRAMETAGMATGGIQRMGNLFDQGEGFGGRNNGRFSFEEIKAGIERAGLHIAQADTNGDGEITATELENMMRRVQTIHNNRHISNHLRALERDGHLDSWKPYLDGNDDGTITREEVMTALQNANVTLSTYDLNDDGMTSGGELQRALQAVATHHNARRER